MKPMNKKGREAYFVRLPFFMGLSSGLSPRIPFHKYERRGQNKHTVDPFGAPYPAQGEMENGCGEVYVQYVEKKHAGFEYQCDECVSGSGHELEIDHGGSHDNGADEYGVEYGNRLHCQGGVIGVYGGHLLWEEGEKRQDGQQSEG